MSPRISPPPFSRQRIVQAAESLTAACLRAVGLSELSLGINFDVAYEQFIYPTYGIILVEDIDLGCDERGEKILGSYDPQRNTAYVDVSLEPRRRDPRRVFTCWHEVGGHGVLQGEWLRREMAQLQSAFVVVTTGANLEFDTVNVIEWQANLFAAHAAAPSWLLKHALVETLNLTRPIRYVGPGKYCLSVRGTLLSYDVESLNELCRVVARQVRPQFGGLSIEALSYRIQEDQHVIAVPHKPFRLNRTASRNPEARLQLQPN
jgi:hypothetical protein